MAGAVGLLCACGVSVAFGQATLGEFSEQRLDRVDVIEAQGATNVAVDVDAQTAAKPWVATDYAAVSGTAFTACQNTSTRGLYCLDGNAVRHWPNPEKLPPLTSVDGRELFNCSNTVFAFDRDNVCTALTVDLGGNLWVAGKKKSKFSLFKVVPGACPSTPANTSASRWTAFTTSAGNFCAREYATGRPLLIDLTVVDGDVAASFPHSLGDGGVIAVEERKEVTFFPDAPQATPVLLGASKAWGLSGNEQLQAATLMQQPLPVDSRNWVLVVTSTGRLLSREIRWDAVVTTVINHSVAGSPINLVAATSCGPTALYDIRTS
ncbi:MAG TPA: hypothetical protein VNS57_11725, partial [Steroidobacteraceae bacterium]|nr:hypothetical protein [Steroidobacteraceae bacterium]